MMGKKRLCEIKAEVAALLGQLPGSSPRSWLHREIASAKRERNHDVETLQMFCAALERETAKSQRPKSQRKPATR
jgi:hypothetical protein